MPKLLRMPDTAVLPEGPVRSLVELLFDYHQIARHPSLEAICEQVARRSEEARSGTASRETIRRMFHGHVPRHWETVEVVFVALCELAGVDPDRKVKYWDDDHGEEVATDRRSQMESTWSAALYRRPRNRAPFQGVDFDYEEPAPPVNNYSGYRTNGSRPSDNSWGTSAPAGGGFSDEPPF